MKIWSNFQCLQRLKPFHQEISKCYTKPTSNGFGFKGKTDRKFAQAIQLQMGGNEIFI